MIRQITEFLQSVDLLFGILGVAAVLLLFGRFLRPSWRILERTIYHHRSYRTLRALGAALQLLYYIMKTESLSRAARLRVEVELLLPPPSREDFQSADLAEYRRQLKKWKRDRDILLAELVDDSRRGTPTINVPTTFSLYKAEDQIRRYFETLRDEPSTRVLHRDQFLTSVRIDAGFIAPLYLITGLLAHFQDRWEPVINEYGRAVAQGNDVLNVPLRKIQTFLFDCWLLWGPSIPLCTCKYWDGVFAMQYGYGDENNSVPVFSRDAALVSEFREELVKKVKAHPIAFQVSVTGKPRWGPAMPQQDKNDFCAAQKAIHDERIGGLILENEDIRLIGHMPDRTYYSAYLWVIFVVCGEDGKPLHGHDERWKGLFPFFEHGNVAELDTYLFQKTQLAREVLMKIDRYLHEILHDSSKITFRYACAIDDSGYGHLLRFPDGTPTIREIMRDQLRTRRYRRLRESGRLYVEHDADMAGYSSCNLPNLVTAYYHHIERH